MNDPVWALIGAVALAFIVRFFNVVLQWLAKVLGVTEPEPITLPPATGTGLPRISPAGASNDDPGTDVPPIDTGRPPT